MLEISFFVISLLATSKGTLKWSGSSCPSIMRPGVVSKIFNTRLPVSSKVETRPLILVCSVIALAASACSISPKFEKAMP